MNAVAETGKECERLVHIKDGPNALIFDNSLYTQDDIIITPFTPYYVCICTPFSVEGENDQIIVTDFDPGNPDIQFRGISATSKEVRIWGVTTLKGGISALEIYVGSKIRLSDVIRNLMISSQMIKEWMLFRTEIYSIL